MTKLDRVIAKLEEVELDLSRCLARTPVENETMNEALIEITKIKIILEKVRDANA